MLYLAYLDVNHLTVELRQVPLAHAMEAAVERLEEDPSKRAEEVEVLVHNLIALVYVSGPEEILVGCLQRWGLRLKGRSNSDVYGVYYIR